MMENQQNNTTDLKVISDMPLSMEIIGGEKLSLKLCLMNLMTEGNTHVRIIQASARNGRWFGNVMGMN